jgi:hypothetical protein
MTLGSDGHEGKAGALDRLVAADRTAGGCGEPLPLGEGEAAFPANRRHKAKAVANSGGPGQMLEVRVHLLFRKGEALGQLQGGKGFLLEQLSHGLANRVHVRLDLFILKNSPGKFPLPGREGERGRLFPQTSAGRHELRQDQVISE